MEPAEAALTPKIDDFRSAPRPALTKDTLCLRTHIRRSENVGFGWVHPKTCAWWDPTLTKGTPEESLLGCPQGRYLFACRPQVERALDLVSGTDFECYLHYLSSRPVPKDFGARRGPRRAEHRLKNPGSDLLVCLI